ncbi:mechanosensitive ion channel family protein [Patescibacteria group bacterium]|nr:mechanosensitive ion channel family protein [Patescibacteria group bacterium]
MTIDLNHILMLTWGDNTVQEYFLAFVVFLVVLGGCMLIRQLVTTSIRKALKKKDNLEENALLQAFSALRTPFYVVVSLFLAIGFLNLPEVSRNIIHGLALVVAVFYAIKSLEKVIEFVFEKVKNSHRKRKEEFNPGPYNLLRDILKVVAWAIAVILILRNLGYDISGLLAGLGIGGLAVALALQNVLGDIFSYFSIQFDKPFQVGDFIEVGKESGTVTKIGIKSSRIRTIRGDELVMPNAKLTSVHLRNFQSMEKRRVVFKLHLSEKTPAKKLKEVSTIITQEISRIGEVTFERAHFKEFSDFGLSYEIAFVVNSSQYRAYLATQQKINLALKERFETEGIELVFPAWRKQSLD